MFESSGRVRVGFEPPIFEFFELGFFRDWVEKIVFKIQNFQVDSGRVNFYKV